MNAGGLVLKLVLSLGAVIAVILLLQRAARRWGGALGVAGSDKIRILSTRSIGPRMSLALVQVMDRTLLVGISPQGIRTVADLGGALPASGDGVRPPLTGSVAPPPVSELAVPPPPGEPAPRQLHRAPGTEFEAELGRRLASLRQRYRSVAEAEAEGGCS